MTKAQRTRERRRQRARRASRREFDRQCRHGSRLQAGTYVDGLLVKRPCEGFEERMAAENARYDMLTRRVGYGGGKGMSAQRKLNAMMGY